MGAINVVLINSVGELMLDEWHCDLIRCPSQCYYWTKDASSVKSVELVGLVAEVETIEFVYLPVISR